MGVSANAKLDAQRVINGSFGEVWLDGEKLADCKGLQAKVDLQKEEIKIPGTLRTGHKLIGTVGKGTMRLIKINSKIAIKVHNAISQGRMPVWQIVSQVADPAAFGSERVELKGVTPDDLTLADWETGKPGELEVPFTFEEWMPHTMIDDEKASASVSFKGVTAGV